MYAARWQLLPGKMTIHINHVNVQADKNGIFKIRPQYLEFAASTAERCHSELLVPDVVAPVLPENVELTSEEGTNVRTDVTRDRTTQR